MPRACAVGFAVLTWHASRDLDVSIFPTPHTARCCDGCSLSPLLHDDMMILVPQYIAVVAFGAQLLPCLEVWGGTTTGACVLYAYPPGCIEWACMSGELHARVGVKICVGCSVGVPHQAAVAVLRHSVVVSCQQDCFCTLRFCSCRMPRCIRTVASGVPVSLQCLQWPGLLLPLL